MTMSQAGKELATLVSVLVFGVVDAGPVLWVDASRLIVENENGPAVPILFDLHLDDSSHTDVCRLQTE